LGYVGCVSAACLARLGHRVYGIDPDAQKIQNIAAGRAPFYEPGLEEVLRETVQAGRLTASTDLMPALAECEVAMICVGTPSARNGNLSTEQLEKVCGQIAEAVQGRTKPLIVTIRSTAFPGTADMLAGPLTAANPNITVVSNPEFLREGAAMDDFMDPSLLVVGGPEQAARAVAHLYADLPVEPSVVDIRTAEMIKYCCNAFHALKIAFANEVGTLSEKLSVPALEVMQTLCKDTRLNISTAYLKPGFAFGGSCLPKDLRAITYRSKHLDLHLPLLESVLPSNERHIDRGVQQVLDLKSARVGVFGLAFKENTDDLRESPVVVAIERWIGKGKDLRIYDPHIKISSIYGANKNFILQAIPHIEKLMVPSLEEMLSWSDAVVVAQKPDGASAARIAASGKPVVNLVAADLKPRS
jgi:GDP-mannose 6-dehydrogenase